MSLERSQHIYKFLPERPYLVRQQQQYVSGTVVAAKIPDEKDKKKKSHKSRKHDKTVQDTQTKSSSHRSDPKAEKKRDRSESPVRKHSSAKGSSLTSKAVSSSGPESGKQPVIQKETSSLFSSAPGVVTTGTGKQSTSSVPPGHGQPTTEAFLPDTGIEHYDLLSENEDNDDRDQSGELSGSDDGQLSDSTETPEQTEEMSRGKQSGQCVAIWAGITSLALKPLSPNRISPTIPGKGKTLVMSKIRKTELNDLRRLSV